METITIRDATGNDVYPIREIQKQSWLETYPNKRYEITREDIFDHFNEANEAYERKMEERKKTINTDPRFHTWVAVTEENKVVGFCIAQKSEENRINALYVCSDFHGKGVGKLLITKALTWIGENKEICIGVASYNDRAIAFYEKFGFRKTNIVPHNDVASLPSGRLIPEIEMSNRVK